MKTLNIRSLLSALTLALVLLLGTGSTFTTALAEETQGKISQEQLDKLAKASPEDREKVRTTAVDKYTQEFCSKIADDAVNLPGQDKTQICKDEIGANINRIIDTPEKGVKGEIDLQQICGSAGSEVSNWGLKKRCISDSVQKVLPAALKATAAGLMVNPTIAGIINTGKAAEKVTEFIKDPKDPFEMLVNHAHEEAVNWTVKVMDTATGSTDFDPTQTWFTTSWAGAAGVGLLLMGIMFLLMLKDLGNGNIDEDEFRNSLLRWGPAAVLMATFGPALMGKLTGVMSALNSGVITARGDDLTSRIIDFVNTLATIDSAMTGLGPLLMIIIFLIMIIAALMLYVVFLIQHFALIMLAYGMALMLGALMNPKWRPGLLKAASTWTTVLFSKTVLLIMMALIFTIDFASIAPDDGLQILSQTVIVILAMGAVAFSPMVLLKYVPMVSSPGAVTMPSGPAVDSYTGGSNSHSETTHMSEQASRGNEKAAATSDTSGPGGASGSAGAISSEDTGSSFSATPAASGASAASGSAGASSSVAPSSSTAAQTSDSSTTAGHESSTSSDTHATGTPTTSTGAPSSSGTSTHSGVGNSAAPADGSTDTGAVDAGEDYSSVKPTTDNGFTPAGSPVTGGSPAAGSPALAPASAPASTPAAAGTSSGAASGSGASGATASGGGAAAGGAFAGVLLAAAATKKAADTGKDTLVGLNAEAANFQDYNSDTQPEGR